MKQKKSTSPMVPFGESVMFKPLGVSKHASHRFIVGTYLGVDPRTNEALFDHEGTIMRSRDIRRGIESENGMQKG